MVSFFDTAISEFLEEIEKQSGESRFTSQIKADISQIVNDVLYEPWDVTTISNVKYKIYKLFVGYQSNRCLITYSIDHSKLHTTREIYIDYKESEAIGNKTILITLKL